MKSGAIKLITPDLQMHFGLIILIYVDVESRNASISRAG